MDLNGLHALSLRLRESWHDMSMKPASNSDMIEGPEAFKRLDALMSRVIKVPRSVVQERREEHKKQSASNPKRRGPKPKKATSVSQSASRSSVQKAAHRRLRPAVLTCRAEFRETVPIDASPYQSPGLLGLGGRLLFVVFSRASRQRAARRVSSNGVAVRF
jgi:hypothetical protein